MRYDNENSVSERPLDPVFSDQISKFPLRFAVPLFFGQSPALIQVPMLNNATATLLKLGDRFLAVTCFHVVDGFRRNDDTGRTLFQIGRSVVAAEHGPISEDEALDLAVFDISSLVGRDGLEASHFYEPVTWPPQSVSSDDILSFAGFPGIWREQVEPNYLRFYSFSSGASEIRSVRPGVITSGIRLEECSVQINHGRVLGSLGGMSGGPVFRWHLAPILRAELVGFIYEYHEGFDLLGVRDASAIKSDGTLHWPW